MAWVNVSRPSTPIERWEEWTGRTVEGVITAYRDNANGRLFDVEDAEGNVRTFGVKTALEEPLKQAPVGTPCRITCKGTVRGKSGREYLDFDVALDLPEGVPDFK